MRGFAEPGVLRRGALTALDSKAWRSPATVSGGAERVIEDLHAFNGALEEYGLRIKTVGAEKVASAHCLELRISDPLCDVHHNVQASTGANLTLVLGEEAKSARSHLGGSQPLSNS